ncbi:MAG: hypothetical protein ABSH19_08655 [Opitutales bacterium]|jgi:hypothetical protein
MQDEINLTHHLSQWRTPARPAGPSPVPTPVQPAERQLRRDGFVWFAYGVFGFFLVAQFLIMAWFASGR